MVKFLEIGLITPPVGLNVYVLKGVVGDAVPLETIFKGICGSAMDILTLVVLILYPEISLWLPQQIIGGLAETKSAREGLARGRWSFEHRPHFV